MKEDKEKYKQDLKKIGNETLDDLEPVLKKTVTNIFKFINDVFNEQITKLFEKRKK